MWPRITIVVPSYNQAPYLAQALESLTSQGYSNLELIVMDGGSTDESVSVIKRYANRIDYWQSEPDGGQAAALAAGFERATGDVLGWLNSDDMLLPGALARVAREFQDDPNCLWLYGYSHVIDEAGRLLWRRSLPQVSQRDLAELSVYLPQESTFFRRDLYEMTGGIDADLHYAMDYDLWLKLMELAPAKRIDASLGCFRFLDGQKSSHADQYRVEERAVKSRLSHEPLPPWQAQVGQWRYLLRSVTCRFAVEGWRAPKALVSSLIRTLLGRTPNLGTSKRIAAIGLFVVGIGVLSTAVVVGRAIHRAFA